MKVKLNVKNFFMSAMLLVTLAANSQTWEQWQYMDRFNVATKDLYNNAQQYYNREVFPIMQQLNAFPAERSAGEINQMQQELKATQDELYKLQCEEYKYSLRTPLEVVRIALEDNGWQKLDRESLQRFDKEWTNSSYLQLITTAEGVGFSALNEIVGKVTDLRLHGFANSQQELDDVLQSLAQSPEYTSLDITTIRRLIKEKTEIVNTLGTTLGNISDENQQFNELGEQRYATVEKWYDIREELDNTLLDACKYCLSAPCVR